MYACEESLDVRRNLLNPNFDGYKLALDVLPKYHTKLPTGVDVVQLREDQYSVHHIRVFGLINHLVLDTFNQSSVYFVDQHWNVKEFRVVIDTQLDSPRTVFTIPDADSSRSKERLNTSLAFPSGDLCLLTDGVGTLYILSTVNRGDSDAPKWEVLWKGEVCSPSVPYVVTDASLRQPESPIQQTPDGSTTVDCLLLHIEKETAPPATGDNSVHHELETAFATLVEWVTLSRKTADGKFEIDRHRQIKGKAAPIYSAVDGPGRAVYMAGESTYDMVYDSLKPVERKEKADKEKDTAKDGEKKDPSYTWTQTMEDVDVTFIVPPGTQKSDINFDLTSTLIRLEIKNGPLLLEGALFRNVDVSRSTWILEARKLEVSLLKEGDDLLMWPEVVVGDKRGEYFVDPDQARIIHERLSHLTSDEPNPDPSGKNTGAASSESNPQMLEECDDCPDSITSMARLDGDTHKVTNAANISTNQWLFNAQLDPKKLPCICLRHDVDGILWQPGPIPGSAKVWLHETTFNALGYVQASKTDKKFAACPPNASYAVICDCTRHVYIYRQPEVTLSEVKNREKEGNVRGVLVQQVVSLDCQDTILGIKQPEGTLSEVKNRKTGEKVTEVSKQQVVSLDCQDTILGMQATNERIFLLTSQRIYVIRVNNVPES